MSNTCNVLVVDDSEIIRAVIIKTIKLAKVEYQTIYQAGNGKEALELLEKHPVNVIFADLNMPVMSGYEMIEELTKRNDFKNIPVIIISSEGNMTKMEKLFSKGIFAFLRKPFTPEQIKKICEQVTEKSKHE